MKLKLTFLIVAVLLMGTVIFCVSCGKNPISSVISGTTVTGSSSGNFTLGLGKI